MMVITSAMRRRAARRFPKIKPKRLSGDSLREPDANDPRRKIAWPQRQTQTMDLRKWEPLWEMHDGMRPAGLFHDGKQWRVLLPRVGETPLSRKGTPISYHVAEMMIRDAATWWLADWHSGEVPTAICQPNTQNPTVSLYVNVCRVLEVRAEI